jgi:hypothetical protein
VLDKPAPEGKEGDVMSERGFTNAPAEGLGGVIVKGRVERLSLISLTDIARLNCKNSNDKVDDSLTNAARRYIFALAAIAEAYPRSTGSHRLRSGCELLNKTSPAIELRGATFDKAEKLIELYNDRERLIAVAKQAMQTLGIPNEVGTFSVSKEALRNEMEPSASAGSSATAEEPAAKRARKRSR